MAAEQQVELGLGQYTPDELARYARVSRALVKQWFGLGTGGGKRDSPGPYLTFVDFVEVLALRAVLLRRKVALAAIREAATRAREESGVERPLAAPHKIYFLREKVVLAVRARGEGIPPSEFDFVEEAHQLPLEFNAHEKPVRYWAYPILVPFPWELVRKGVGGRTGPFYFREWVEGAGLPAVLMDPQMCFGEPTVLPKGYTAETLWEAVEVEGVARRAAEANGVSEAEVLIACAYIDHLRGGEEIKP